VELPSWQSIEQNWQKLVAVAGLTFLSFRYFRKTRNALKTGVDVALYPFTQLRALANALDGLSGEMRELRGCFGGLQLDLKQIGDAATAANHKVAMLFEDSQSAHFECEMPSGKCVYANRKLRELFGLSFAEMLGDGWTAVVHPDDVDEVRTHWQETVQSWRPYRRRYRILKNGQPLTVEATATVIRSPKGEPISVWGKIEPLAITIA